MKHSFQGSGARVRNRRPAAGSPGARSQSAAFAVPRQQRALLREVHVLQLPHFLLVFLLEFLCCFILRAKSQRQSRSVKQGTNHKYHPYEQTPPTPTQEAALTKCT